MTEARRTWRWPSRAQPLVLLADGLWDLRRGAHHADFAAWCALHPGQRCQLWLGAGEQTDVLCDDAAPVRADAERGQWALRVLAHYHGEPALGWPVLPWRQGRRWGASALRGAALSTWQDQARLHGVHLLGVRPLWPQLLQRLLARQDALRSAPTARVWLLEAGPQHGSVSCFNLAHGELQAVQRRRLQAPWGSALQALLDESPDAPVPVLLWLGAPAGSALPLAVAESLAPPYPGLLHARAARGPDYLRPEPRPTGLAWAWLGSCVLVLGLAAWDARASWQARLQAQQVALPAPVRVAAVRAPAIAVDPAQAQRLAHPWREVFQASETPGLAGLTWLTLEHQQGADLRLQGLAPDPAPVRRAAAALRNRAAWQQVLVSRVEALPSGAQSFEIVARLAPASP
jgi:hypothetical protein